MRSRPSSYQGNRSQQDKQKEPYSSMKRNRGGSQQKEVEKPAKKPAPAAKNSENKKTTAAYPKHVPKPSDKQQRRVNNIEPEEEVRAAARPQADQKQVSYRSYQNKEPSRGKTSSEHTQLQSKIAFSSSYSALSLSFFSRAARWYSLVFSSD